jgi:hypothetical protein
MPTYLVTHDVRQMYGTQEAWVRDWEGLKRRSMAVRGVHWLNSWYSAQSNRLYCMWEAPDPDAIRSCFVPEELKKAPITGLEEVAHVNPEWLLANG